MCENDSTYMSGLPFSLEPIHFCEVSPKKIYYHYTSLEKMWLILDGEGLRATQAGFSNDNEEISMGIQAVQNICKTIFENSNDEMMSFINNISRDTLDSYIICFCDKDDKLSQWRAYCKDGGVSIGFAFDDSEPPYYYQKRLGFSCIPTTCKLYPVFYLNYDSKCTETPNTITQDELKSIIYEKLESIGDVHAKKQAILELIPYIKHCGFCEEEEHRLLIDNPLDFSMYNTTFKNDDVVEYFDKDNGQRSPYIGVQFCNETKSKNPNIRIFGNKDDYQTISNKILDIIKNYNLTLQDKDNKINLDGKLIHVNSKEQKIIIGQTETEYQKFLFSVIDRINNPLYTNKEENKNIIPIWCDGHLPIRSITVAPSLDKERIVSMIKHHCTHNQFWMKYVTVTSSKIPYRSY